MAEETKTNADYPAHDESNVIRVKSDYPQQQSGPGILKTIEDTIERVGEVIQEKLEAAGQFIESEWNKHNLGLVLTNFVTGAKIQLISKTSGRSLHIVRDSSGELIVEAKGGIGPQAWNAVWTVFVRGDNQVHLYNYSNFLGIVNGETKVIHVEKGSPLPDETKLQLVLNGELLVALQSTVGHGQCICINTDGSLMPAKNCRYSDQHSLFGVIQFKPPQQKTESKDETKEKPMEQTEAKQDQTTTQSEDKKDKAMEQSEDKKDPKEVEQSEEKK